MLVQTEGLAEVLSCHAMVSSIVQDYCTTLCAALRAERPALSDIRANIQLDEDHVICAMPQDSRLQMSLPALRALRITAGNNVKQINRLAELESEVRDGRCYLGSDSRGCVLRIVHVVTLRLFRWDGLLCAKVGQVKEGTTIHREKAKLPGTKTRAGEMPRQALDRLIGKELAMMNPVVEGHPEVEVEEAPSESYGVTTKYVRTIFTAHMGESEETVETTMLPPGQQDDILERMILFHARGYDDGAKPNEASAYAWMTVQDFSCLAKADSRGPAISLISSI